MVNLHVRMVRSNSRASVSSWELRFRYWRTRQGPGVPLDHHVETLTRRRLAIPQGERVIPDVRAARHLMNTITAPDRDWVRRIFEDELEITSTPQGSRELIDYEEFARRVVRNWSQMCDMRVRARRLDREYETRRAVAAHIAVDLARRPRRFPGRRELMRQEQEVDQLAETAWQEARLLRETLHLAQPESVPRWFPGEARSRESDPRFPGRTRRAPSSDRDHSDPSIGSTSIGSAPQPFEELPPPSSSSGSG